MSGSSFALNVSFLWLTAARQINKLVIFTIVSKMWRRIIVVIFLAPATVSLGLAFPDMSHLFYGEIEDGHRLYNFGRFYFTKQVFRPMEYLYRA